MGLLRFSPRGWQKIAELMAKMGPEACDRLDMTSLLQRLLNDGVVINTVAIAEPWYEVDSESDLRLYEAKFFPPGSES